MEALLVALEWKRDSLALSQAAFARRCLGVSPAYWSLVRRGLRPLGGAVVRGVLRDFPDLGLVLHGACRESWLAPAQSERSTR